MAPTLPLPIPPLDSAAWHKLTLPERALQVAHYLCDRLHAQETPEHANRSAWVDLFLTTARADTGQPWCAAFATYCLVKAGWDPFSADFKKGVRYPASVVSWAAWAQAVGRWSRTPKRGRLFVIARPGHTHIGWVVQDLGDGTFSTIEGNSNDDGSREGYETCRRVRKVSEVSGFIDLMGAA
jgi:hypothetical protein